MKKELIIVIGAASVLLAASATIASSAHKNAAPANHARHAQTAVNQQQAGILANEIRNASQNIQAHSPTDNQSSQKWVDRLSLSPENASASSDENHPDVLSLPKN